MFKRVLNTRLSPATASQCEVSRAWKMDKG